MSSITHINPVRDLPSILARVEQPARYVGGEVDSTFKSDDTLLTVALCFPDMYEIGMSNTAMRILYDLINGRTDCRCERVFTPAVDMETELREAGVPLYTLETGIPLHQCDLIAFTVSYELSATNMVAVLDAGGVPIRRDKRRDNHPYVIAGGPAITNPTPFGVFVDGVCIGDAEEILPSILEKLAREKRLGRLNRPTAAEAFGASPYVYCPDEPTKPVRRAWWAGFGSRPDIRRFPIPSLRPVQDNAVVEIMRGCPNGCRFCHAGRYYRPYRMKDVDHIVAEVDHAVLEQAYNEVTLASLSSGDYPGIGTLVALLHERYRGKNVSFSLPSLKVDTFSLPTIEALSGVRRSGLTFAVESPFPEGQAACNKLVPWESVAAILKEAQKRGWRSAKLYFMIGLPRPTNTPEMTPRGSKKVAPAEGVVPASGGCRDEASAIADYVLRLRDACGMDLHVNVGTFVPKPHTAFQWMPQLAETEAEEAIGELKALLKRSRGVRLTYHSPFQSSLEGILSRGTALAGELVVDAYKAGARFDAWEDRARRGIWRAFLADTKYSALREDLTAQHNPDVPLPWETIDFAGTHKDLDAEYKAAVRGQLTERCLPTCRNGCSVCRGTDGVRHVRAPTDKLKMGEATPPITTPEIAERTPVLISFSRSGPGAYLSHLDTMRAFQRALVRSGLEPGQTKGFNPKVSLEFAQPASLGMTSNVEYMRTTVSIGRHFNKNCDLLGQYLPEGITVTGVIRWPRPASGRRPKSLMALWWGADYEVTGESGALSAIAEAAERFAGIEVYQGPERLSGGDSAGEDTSISVRLSNHDGLAPGIGKLLGMLDIRGKCRVHRVNAFAAGEGGAPVAYEDLAHADANPAIPADTAGDAV